MSLREKELWGSLIAGLVVWGAYAVWATPILFGPYHPHPVRTVGLAFMAALAAFVLVEAGLAGFVAWFRRRHRPAQDLALTEAGLVAGQIAFLVLIAGVVLMLIGLFFFAASMEWGHDQYSVGVTVHPRLPLLLAHLVLALLLLTEGVRAAVTLLLVRRRR